MPRRFGSLSGTVVVCPDGRRVGRVVRPGDTHFALECAHREGNSRVRRLSETAHWLYLLPDGSGRTLVAECTNDEVRTIERERFTAAEVRAFLDVAHASAA